MYNLVIRDSDVMCGMQAMRKGGWALTSLIHASLTISDHDWRSLNLYSDDRNYQSRNAILQAHWLLWQRNLTSQSCRDSLLWAILKWKLIQSTATLNDWTHWSIFHPMDHVNIMLSARPISRPYEVMYLDHSFFKEFSKIGVDKTICSLRKAARGPNCHWPAGSEMHYRHRNSVQVELSWQLTGIARAKNAEHPMCPRWSTLQRNNDNNNNKCQQIQASTRIEFCHARLKPQFLWHFARVGSFFHTSQLTMFRF